MVPSSQYVLAIERTTDHLRIENPYRASLLLTPMYLEVEFASQKLTLHVVHYFLATIPFHYI